MPYSTVEAFLASYPRMASTQVNSATLYSWLSRASNYIDGYIAQAVDLPTDGSPPYLKELSEDVAHVMFLRRNTHESGKDQGVDNIWKDVTQRLENMRNGTFTLLSGSGTILSKTTKLSNPWSSTEGYVPTFIGGQDIEDAEGDYNRRDAERLRRSWVVE